MIHRASFLLILFLSGDIKPSSVVDGVTVIAIAGVVTFAKETLNEGIFVRILEVTMFIIRLGALAIS